MRVLVGHPVRLTNNEEERIHGSRLLLKLENVRTRRRVPSAYVTINRPKVLNALNGKTISALRSAFKRPRHCRSARSRLYRRLETNRLRAAARARTSRNGNDIRSRRRNRRRTEKHDTAKRLLHHENLGKDGHRCVNAFALAVGL